MKKLYPKTPDEKVDLCSGFEPYTDKDGDFGVYNTDLKKFVVIQSKAAREQLEDEHKERLKNGILRAKYSWGEPPLTKEEMQHIQKP